MDGRGTAGHRHKLAASRRSRVSGRSNERAGGGEREYKRKSGRVGKREIERANGGRPWGCPNPCALCAYWWIGERREAPGSGTQSQSM